MHVPYDKRKSLSRYLSVQKELEPREKGFQPLHFLLFQPCLLYVIWIICLDTGKEGIHAQRSGFGVTLHLVICNAHLVICNVSHMKPRHQYLYFYSYATEFNMFTLYRSIQSFLCINISIKSYEP